jgi:DNA polymerase-1
MLIMDGDSLAHRAYHGMPKTIRRADGKAAGALLGFANTLLRLHRETDPDSVVVGWDTLDAPTYRHVAFPDYQSGRVFDADLIEQLEMLPDLVAACGFGNGKAPGYEADDFLAAAASRAERRDQPAIIVSSDRDTFQLVTARTRILQPAKGGEWTCVDEAEVRARYGVEPAQVPDFIALRGDPSDRIPGARGVGAATAASLLRKHGDLETLLASGRFRDQADALRLYKRMATMDAKAPLPVIRAMRPRWAEAADLVEHWGLRALASRLREQAATKSPR